MLVHAYGGTWAAGGHPPITPPAQTLSIAYPIKPNTNPDLCNVSHLLPRSAFDVALSGLGLTLDELLANQALLKSILNVSYGALHLMVM